MLRSFLRKPGCMTTTNVNLALSNASQWCIWHACAYQGKFDVLCFLVTPVLRFVFLPFGRRYKHHLFFRKKYGSWMHDNRSSRSQMFFKMGVPKNFAIFTKKHMCWNLFLLRLQPWRPTTLLKKDSNTGIFLWILRNL